MTNFNMPGPASHSIGAVERDTGLGKDTLRVWERRYHFPQPLRDANGERVYPLDQVNKLRLLKRLIDGGHRPGKIIHLDHEDLQRLVDGNASDDTGANHGEHADLQAYIALCKSRDVGELRRTLTQALLRTGLQGFVLDVIAPLNRMVGDCWARGMLSVHEEHVYTELVQNLLRNAIAAITQHQGHAHTRPCILLTTFPNEQHALGLLMAEAMFALEGARCISLGPQTPILDIVKASHMHHVDIVALSFTPSMGANTVLAGLNDLRSSLPATTDIWAGGSNSALTRRSLKAAQVLTLDDVPAALAGWRQRHGEPK